jgi:methenyltetrahydromethanopterin cyclohydrolase
MTFSVPAMKARLNRLISTLVLAALAFAQASLAFSACQLDRGSLARSLGAAEQNACESGCMVASAWTKYANRCVAHCTADLAVAGSAVPLVRHPADAPVLALLSAQDGAAALRVVLEAAPPGAPPRRILLHSFLI